MPNTHVRYLYQHGYGGPQDYREFVVWFGLASEQGFADAQYALGFLYENGMGVLVDLKVVFKDFQISFRLK